MHTQPLQWYAQFLLQSLWYSHLAVVLLSHSMSLFSKYGTNKYVLIQRGDQSTKEALMDLQAHLRLCMKTTFEGRNSKYFRKAIGDARRHRRRYRPTAWAAADGPHQAACVVKMRAAGGLDFLEKK